MFRKMLSGIKCLEKTKEKIAKALKKSLITILAFAFLTGVQVYASNQSQFSQAISAGSLGVDIVDAGGSSVSSPAVSFGAKAFSFDTQDATATFGTASEKVRASNPTSTAAWTVNLAGNATTDSWTSGSNHYDFNDTSGYTDGVDTDSYGGQMTVDPSAGTLAGISGCATTNVSKGTSDSFVEGSANSIDIMSAATGASTFCRWDLTGVGLTQKIPSSQASGSYSLTMVLTVL